MSAHMDEIKIVMDQGHKLFKDIRAKFAGVGFKFFVYDKIMDKWTPEASVSNAEDFMDTNRYELVGLLNLTITDPLYYMRIIMDICRYDVAFGGPIIKYKISTDHTLANV